MKTKTSLLIISLIISFLFVRCKKDDSKPGDSVQADNFTCTFTNNRIVPCKVLLQSNITDANKLLWSVDDVFIADTSYLEYDFTTEGYYKIGLEARYNQNNINENIVVWVYNDNYVQAWKVIAENISCASFNYKGLTFNFESTTANKFKICPVYYPIGDPDLGSDYDAFNETKNRIVYTIGSNDTISGTGIYFYDVLLKTDKVELNFNYKFYVFITNSCIDSVRAYDFDNPSEDN